MKRSWIKRKTPLVRSKIALRRTKLRVSGHSTTHDIKEDIQAILREIVILRDGGCLLRLAKDEIVPQYKNCGGFRKDGELILQAEHLHTRGNANAFSDSRLVICLCKRHHLFYKKQYPDEYYKIVKKLIGEERSKLLDAVMADHRPHKVDLQMELIALKQELEKLIKETI